MQREGETNPPPPTSTRLTETAPISRGPAAVRHYEKSHSTRKRYVALVIGLVAAFAAFALYRQFGTTDAASEAPSAAPQVATSPPKVAEPPPPAATVAPTPAPTAGTSGRRRSRSRASRRRRPPPRAGRAARRPPAPAGASAEEQHRAGSGAARRPRPRRADGDLANPYR